MALVTARGLTPAKLELMDQNSIRAVEQFMKMGLPNDAEAILVSDCDGDHANIVNYEIESVAEAFREAGAREVRIAQTPEEAAQLWKARRSVSPALGNIRPNRFNEDIVVPRSTLEPAMREMQAISSHYPEFPFAIFGHAGDGNLHPNILYTKATDNIERVDEFAHEIARVAIRHGGVLSGDTAYCKTLAAASQGADMLVCEAMNAASMTSLIGFLRAGGREREAGLMSDVPSYHISTLDIAKLAALAGVGEVVLSHIIPPLPNDADREAAFMAGMSDIYGGRVRVARDMQRLPITVKTRA